VGRVGCCVGGGVFCGLAFTDIAMHNIVWCMAYKRGIGGGSNIVQKYCNSIATVWAMQVGGGAITGRLIRAQRPRSKTISCKSQPVGVSISSSRAETQAG